MHEIDPHPQHAPAIGRRIHVIGNSASGKSTLGKRLARILDVPFVELDALNWQPNWVALNDANPQELERRMTQATAGDGWVVAGSYTALSQRAFWPRLQTVIWIDLPMIQLVWRVLIRSWRRWRSQELLWGTNYESFWRQLMVWRKEESLIWWIVTQQRRKRRRMLACMTYARWRHIRFIRLTSVAEVEELALSIEQAFGQSRPTQVTAGVGPAGKYKNSKT